QYRGTAVFSRTHAAHRARLHPGERRHRGHRLSRAGRAAVGPSPAGVRFRGPHRRCRTRRLGRLTPGAPSRSAKGDARMNDTASGSWTLARDADGLAWLTIDKPGTSANVLSSG